MCIHKTIMGHAFICHKNEAIHIHEFFKNTFSLKSAKTKKKKHSVKSCPYMVYLLAIFVRITRHHLTLS